MVMILIIRFSHRRHYVSNQATSSRVTYKTKTCGSPAQIAFLEELERKAGHRSRSMWIFCKLNIFQSVLISSKYNTILKYFEHSSVYNV